MLYIYAFYSIKLPDWIGYTPKQVKFIIEGALHRYLDKIGIFKIEPIPISDLGPNYEEGTYRLINIIFIISEKLTNSFYIELIDKKVRDFTSKRSKSSKRSKRSKKRKGGKSSFPKHTFSSFSSQTSSTRNSSQTSSTVCNDNGGTENVSCEEDDLLKDDKGNDISQAVKDKKVDYVFRLNSVYISLL
jgi:hypothetical protein